MSAAATPFETLSKSRAWYSHKAWLNRLIFLWLKGAQIVLAAAIPASAAVMMTSDRQKALTAVIGALVGILEGILQLGQFQQSWLQFRATSEALRREEFLLNAKIGPYVEASSPDTLYFERCDAIITGEHAKWLQRQESGTKDAGKS